MAKFASSTNALDLMDMVREVTLFASAEAPTAVTQRAFDDARRPAGHPDAPQAKSIAARLRLPWRDVLLAAHAGGSDGRNVASRRKGAGARHGLSLEQVLNALRIVASHREQESLARWQYKVSRERIVARDGRGRHGGRIARALPSLNTVDVLLDKEGLSWEGACDKAGLRPSDPSAYWSTRSLSWDDAIGVFIAHTGHAPQSVGQIRKWASEIDVPLKKGSRPVVQLVTAMQNDRQAAGFDPLPLAPKEMPFRGLPKLEGYGRRPESWNPTTIVLGLAAAVRRTPTNEILILSDLQALRDEYPDDGIPGQSTVISQAKKHHASFEQWRREAYELVKRGDAP